MMVSILRFLKVGLALLTCVPTAAPAAAQEFPAGQPVKITVPFSPGGTTDILARQLAVELVQQWGVTVIVENRAGASGTIFSEQLTRLPADGLSMTHIPYQGAAPALNDLLGGTIPVMFDSLPGVIQHIRSGRLRALGVTTVKRSAAAPEIPTLDESGIKGFEATAWFGLYAPAGMKPELLRKISADVLKALASPKIRAQFAEQGAEPGVLNPAEFSPFVNAEIDKWGRVISSANVKIE